MVKKDKEESHKELPRGKIRSLQALRGIAFLGVFWLHAGSPYKWSALFGVSTFFVLSGFLLFIRHGNDDVEFGLIDRMKFSWLRVKKLYPLHILTMMCSVILSAVSLVKTEGSFRPFVILLMEIALNVTLLQSWVPYSPINVSLNGVSWYLSVTMFLYFMFPLIQRFVSNRNQKALNGFCILILLLQYFTCIIFLYTFGYSLAYVWFMYCFPVFRLGDFFVGCVLGKYYLSSEKMRKQSNTVIFSIFEILLSFITIVIFKWSCLAHESIFLLALCNWTTIYIPLAAFWVCMFAFNNGIVTRMLSNRIFIFFGDFSPQMYLIHYVIASYVNYAIITVQFQLPLYIIAIIELSSTIIATLLYIRISKVLRKRVIIR